MTEVRNIYISANFIQNSPNTITSLEEIDLYNIPFVDNTMGYPWKDQQGYHHVDGAFNGCTNLTSVLNINSDISDIGEAFKNCSSLVTSPEIPNNISSLTRTFQNCVSLTVTPNLSNSSFISSMVQTYENCIELEHVSNMPTSVGQMELAFHNCHKLKTFDSFPSGIHISNGILYPTNMYRTFYNCTSLVNAPSIPPITNCMYGTFYNCTSLVNAPSIPYYVSSLSQAFYNCTSLVNAPNMSHANYVTDLTGTFVNCRSLNNISYIPSGVSYLKETFVNCINLEKSPVIPESTTSMFATYAFCSNLTGNIFIESINIQNCVSSFYGTSKEKNVYVPFYVDTAYDFVWLGEWVNISSGLEFYVPDDFSNISKKCEAEVYSDAYVYNYSAGGFQRVGIILYSPTPLDKTNTYNIMRYNSSTGYYEDLGRFTYNRSINGSLSVGNNTLTYDSFLAQGYSSSERNATDGVQLFDLNEYYLNSWSHYTDNDQIRLVKYTGNDTYVNVSKYKTIYNNVNYTNTENSPFYNNQLITDCNLKNIPWDNNNMCDAFHNCIELKNITNINNNVTNMYGAFNGCSSLIYAPTIPNSVVDLSSCFENCVDLAGVIYILSTNIINVVNCFNGTSLYKDVAFPFYTNIPNPENPEEEIQVETQTYNTFINAGYSSSERNAIDGVQLFNLNIR